MQSVRALMEGIVDYAGLFPPAQLEMRPAVENFAAYAQGDFAWMLSRFICPVSRFQEFEAAAAPFLGQLEQAEAPADEEDEENEAEADGGPYFPDAWLLAALCRLDDFKTQVESIFDLMERQGGRLFVDAIEIKIGKPSDVDAVLNVLPEAITPFFEFPLSGDIRGFAAAISGTSAGAKIRTGGVTPDLVPSPEQVATFLRTCAQAEVPFKATAGLHQPLRHHDRAVGADAFGFLNVFLAGLLAGDLGDEELRALLVERSLDAFEIEEDSIAYGGLRLQAEQIEQGRAGRCLSFGSCSFVEPIEELRALGLL
jgi:hypothetical protein